MNLTLSNKFKARKATWMRVQEVVKFVRLQGKRLV